jgi:hypothetical protein
MRRIWIAIGLIVALAAIYYAAQGLVSFIIGMISAFPIIWEMASAGISDITQVLVRSRAPSFLWRL